MFMRIIRQADQYHYFLKVKQGSKILVLTKPFLVLFHYVKHILVSGQVFITEVVLHLQKRTKMMKGKTLPNDHAYLKNERNPSQPELCPL